MSPTTRKPTFNKPRNSQEMAGTELAERAFCLSASSPFAGEEPVPLDWRDNDTENLQKQVSFGEDLAARIRPVAKKQSGASRAGDELSRRALSLSMASPEVLPSNEAGEDLAERIRT